MTRHAYALFLGALASPAKRVLYRWAVRQAAYFLGHRLPNATDSSHFSRGARLLEQLELVRLEKTGATKFSKGRQVRWLEYVRPDMRQRSVLLWRRLGERGAVEIPEDDQRLHRVSKLLNSLNWHNLTTDQRADYWDMYVGQHYEAFILRAAEFLQFGLTVQQATTALRKVCPPTLGQDLRLTSTEHFLEVVAAGYIVARVATWEGHRIAYTLLVGAFARLDRTPYKYGRVAMLVSLFLRLKKWRVEELAAKKPDRGFVLWLLGGRTFGETLPAELRRREFPEVKRKATRALKLAMQGLLGAAQDDAQLRRLLGMQWEDQLKVTPTSTI